MFQNEHHNKNLCQVNHVDHTIVATLNVAAEMEDIYVFSFNLCHYLFQLQQVWTWKSILLQGPFLKSLFIFILFWIASWQINYEFDVRRTTLSLKKALKKAEVVKLYSCEFSPPPLLLLIWHEMVPGTLLCLKSLLDASMLKWLKEHFWGSTILG